MRFLPTFNRVASHVARKLPDDVHHVNTSASQAVVRTRNIKRRLAMPRQLISVLQFIEEAKEQNLDLSQVFLDRDDLAEIPEVEEEE